MFRKIKRKVLKKYKKYIPLKILIERLKKCKKVSNIIICTTKLAEDDKSSVFAKKKILNFSEELRTMFSLVIIIVLKNLNQKKLRVTSDCPLVDFRIINSMLNSFLNLNIDYMQTYPLPTLILMEWILKFLAFRH